MSAEQKVIYVRVGAKLHAMLSEQAKQRGVSLNELALAALTERDEDAPAPVRVLEPPASGDIVQVLMREEMARRFAERCLGTNTKAPTRLSPPLAFGQDDLPTYIIEVVT